MYATSSEYITQTDCCYCMQVEWFSYIGSLSCVVIRAIVDEIFRVRIEGA